MGEAEARRGKRKGGGEAQKAREARVEAGEGRRWHKKDGKKRLHSRMKEKNTGR